MLHPDEEVLKLESQTFPSPRRCASSEDERWDAAREILRPQHLERLHDLEP